eukprot:scaffold1878_cov258-Pinguiococcus_pyrenoidosus.AAC.6
MSGRGSLTSQPWKIRERPSHVLHVEHVDIKSLVGVSCVHLQTRDCELSSLPQRHESLRSHLGRLLLRGHPRGDLSFRPSQLPVVQIVRHPKKPCSRRFRFDRLNLVASRESLGGQSNHSLELVNLRVRAFLARRRNAAPAQHEDLAAF